MIKQAAKYSLLVATLMGMSATVTAEAAGHPGYLNDTRGAIVTSGAGLCWHTSEWTPAMAVADCDPSFIKKKAPPPPPPPMAKPAPAPAPAPKPVMVKVKMGADTLFSFDKAKLRPYGKLRLDQLAAKIKQHHVKLEVIIAVGYTDRIGSIKYNLKLSDRRAAAVKNYLVDQGIPANRIYTEGKGKADPVTKPGQCRGRRVTRKLIACLQPDRRVEVEVIGTAPKKHKKKHH